MELHVTMSAKNGRVTIIIPVTALRLQNQPSVKVSRKFNEIEFEQNN